MDALSIFLAADVDRGFAWGEHDCLLRLAAWGKTLMGRDAGAPWRGRCRSALGAARILKREGGMAAVTARAFEAIGWRRTDNPRRGAVAIVALPEGETGGIVFGGGLVAAAHGGKVQLRRGTILAAWEWRADDLDAEQRA